MTLSRSRRARLALAAAAVTAAAGLSLPAHADDPVPGSDWSSVYFPSKDGTSLHGDLLLPSGGCPTGGCPVIVSIGPYYGHSTQDSFPVPTPDYAGPASRFYDFIGHEFGDKGTIFDQGYAWLQVDSRGYGVSGGCSDYGGVGEQQDVYAAVEWAGTQAWSSGKVGMWGKSYDGWTQVMGLAENPPHLEATVIQSPLVEGYGIGYVHGVHHSATWYATTGLYALYDYTPNAIDQTDPQALVNTTAGATGPCWPYQAAIASAGNDHDLEYWRQRDLRPSASANDDVAVLWSHGFNDVNTKPDQIFGVYGPLNDLPKSNHRAWFGQWDHVRGNEADKTGREGFLEESLDWFDHYLKGADFQYGANEKNVVEVQDNEGAWRTEAQYPPADVQTFTFPLRTGTYADNGSTSTGYWTVSQPVVDEFRITGEPVMNVKATAALPLANLVGVLYDLGPDGKATEISRGAYRFEGLGGEASFTLHPRDHVMREGHRLAFDITAMHPQFQPHPTMQTVTVTAASVDVPVPAFARESNLVGTEALAKAYVVTPPVAAITAGSTTVTLPTTPTPTAEQRERLQPTVSTPAG